MFLLKEQTNKTNQLNNNTGKFFKCFAFCHDVVLDPGSLP